MNISRENIDDLNAILKVKIVKADFEEKVEKVLRDYRKKANIRGFRPGMVPIGIIRKMYGKAVKAEEINRTVSENIQKYLSDEKIEILGDPMPKIDDNEIIDFENQDDFNFSFELGLTPVIELNINKKHKVNSYNIIIDEKMKTDHVGNYSRRFGEFLAPATSGEKDILKGDITKTDDDGKTDQSALSRENATLAIDIIKDEEIRKSFTGRKINDNIDFDIRKALPNTNEIAGLLMKQKEEAEAIEGSFRFTIREIKRFRPAEIGQELFDKIYGEGVVTTEEEFMKKIEEEISAGLTRERDYKLLLDIKKLALGKTEIKLPEDFLKKWLLNVNKNATKETLEKEFDSFRDDLRWQLIKNKIAKDNNIIISEEDLQKEAESITRFQFHQYGLYYATDEQIANYAREMLRKEEDAKRIADKILDNNVLAHLKELIKIEEKSVTAEEFNKLFSEGA
jgi:trigger factor